MKLELEDRGNPSPDRNFEKVSFRVARENEPAAAGDAARELRRARVE